MNETEALIASDPTKLADAAANAQGTGQVGPIWNLDLNVPGNDAYSISDVMRFQQRLATMQYVLPRMISAVSKPCNGGGSPDNPTTYNAWTALREGSTKRGHEGTEGQYLQPETRQLQSIHLNSGDAKTVGTFLFGSPYQKGVMDAINTGPAGAALAPSPFFMTQIAPTSSFELDSWHHCGENF